MDSAPLRELAELARLDLKAKTLSALLASPDLCKDLTEVCKKAREVLRTGTVLVIKEDGDDGVVVLLKRHPADLKLLDEVLALEKNAREILRKHLGRLSVSLDYSDLEEEVFAVWQGSKR